MSIYPLPTHANQSHSWIHVHAPDKTLWYCIDEDSKVTLAAVSVIPVASEDAMVNSSSESMFENNKEVSSETAMESAELRRRNDDVEDTVESWDAEEKSVFSVLIFVSMKFALPPRRIKLSFEKQEKRI